MFARSQFKEATLTLNTAGTVTAEFYFPKGGRVKSYYAVPAVIQAAHSTIVDTVTFTNRSTDGAGTTDVAVLTNDTDLADSVTRVSSAWAAHVVKRLNCEDRPGDFANTTDVADEIAVGGVVSCALLGAGTTPTANFFTVGIEFWESD